ncbi:protein kinase domain-containing protein [Paraclostridium sp. AKS73]|uniref:protein kinase domain-containing protein n=1 Tax=Paraclostridium sp. AKS73 TaxID=2876116 RepID=UPI0029586F17|nr:protein kinase [Paraclostridium sp. AKS73]
MGETVLGNRYEIIKKIGDGGMAFVYEARDKLLNRTVAIKVLRPEFVDDEEFLTKFKREAEAVASLSHPNIVNVYDVGEDGKVHYIVMELIEGQNLKDIIKNEGTLDEYTALDIAKQIAKALGAAHRKGIIHRDIKPHNILISNEGRIVKVADFGIAKAVSSSTITSTGSVIGSVHYFSPEQAKGKFVSNTTDLYSLGIVLYEMIIGRVPFTGESPISIALQHINEEIEFTQEEKVAIPQSVRNIIKKLTSKSSDDRYQGADELIEDIEYIEKNIDLDFIKEYDNYATQKIDEAELNKALKLAETKPQNIYEDDEVEEELDNVVPTKSSSRKNKKKNKKRIILKVKKMENSSYSLNFGAYNTNRSYS